LPILEIADLPAREAPLHVWAAMMFPRDAQRRRAFVDAARNTIVRDMLGRTSDDEIKRTPNALPFIVAAATGPHLDSFLAKEKTYLYTRALLRPALAGLILAYVLSCAAWPEAQKPPTLNHAVKMLTDGAGARRVPVHGLSRDSLVDLWTEFAPAAHLSAVKLLIPGLWLRCGEDPGALRRFLALAENLRLLGERHRPPRARKALLDQGETWCVPDSIGLRPAIDKLPRPADLAAIIGPFCAGLP
jgi:hypothetical protein